MTESTLNLTTGRDDGTAAAPKTGRAASVADARRIVAGSRRGGGEFFDPAAFTEQSLAAEHGHTFQPAGDIWHTAETEARRLGDVPTDIPPAVAKHWRALGDAVEAVVEAVTDGLSLDGQHASARRAAVQKIAQQIAGGEKVTPTRLPDLETARMVAEATITTRLAEARKARAAFDAALAEALPKWHAQMDAELPDRVAELEDGLKKAAAAIGAITTSLDRLREREREKGVTYEPNVGLSRALPEGIQAGLDAVEQHREILLGKRLGRRKISPSWDQRAATARKDGAVIGSLGWSVELRWLAYREAVEAYEHTSYTRAAAPGLSTSDLQKALPPGASLPADFDWTKYQASAEREAQRREAAERAS